MCYMPGHDVSITCFALHRLPAGVSLLSEPSLVSSIDLQQVAGSIVRAAQAAADGSDHNHDVEGRSHNDSAAMNACQQDISAAMHASSTISDQRTDFQLTATRSGKCSGVLFYHGFESAGGHSITPYAAPGHAGHACTIAATCGEYHTAAAHQMKTAAHSADDASHNVIPSPSRTVLAPPHVPSSQSDAGLNVCSVALASCLSQWLQYWDSFPVVEQHKVRAGRDVW